MMVDDEMGDVINPYDLGHVADIRSGRRKAGRRVDYRATSKSTATQRWVCGDCPMKKACSEDVRAGNFAWCEEALDFEIDLDSTERS